MLPGNQAGISTVKCKYTYHIHDNDVGANTLYDRFDKKLESIPIIQKTTGIENNVNNYVVDKLADAVDDSNDQEEVRSG